MSIDMRENTNRRLKAVLDIMAAGVWAGQDLGGGAVLAEAIVQVPLNDQESELLSGGIPRGHKNLTAATAKLVKAGWLRKAGGWSITDDGLRAVVAFPDEDALAVALEEGTPVPADMPVPTAPLEQPKPAKAVRTAKAPEGAKTAKAAAAPKAATARSRKAGAAQQPAGQLQDEAVNSAPASDEAPADAALAGEAPAASAAPVSEPAPTAKKTKSRKAAAVAAPELFELSEVPAGTVRTPTAPRTTKTQTRAAAPVTSSESTTAPETLPAPEPVSGTETDSQPDAVAVVGDFSTLLGAPENWVPSFDEVQMTLDTVDRLWKLVAELPAGYYTYKVAINRGWDENYGAFGVRSGANHELHHGGGPITFRYDHNTRDVSID